MPGLPRYTEKAKDTKQSDETLTVMLIIGIGVGTILIGMTMVKDAMDAKALRRRRPWDV